MKFYALVQFDTQDIKDITENIDELQIKLLDEVVKVKSGIFENILVGYIIDVAETSEELGA